MKIQTTELIAELSEKTRFNICKVEGLIPLSESVLNFKQNNDTWSVLECIEHLNLYGDFYIREINRSIEKSNTSSHKIFESGMLGNYFVHQMKPKDKLKKMKTFKSMNPSGSNLDKDVLARFIHQQNEYLQLLTQSNTINISKTKTVTSISKFVTMRIGDAFRFIVAHNERHLLQVEKILQNVSK